MDYNDLNNENMSDELNNPSSSSLHSNNFTGGLISGINEAKKHSQTDIDAIKNRTGKNEGIGRKFDDEQPKQKSSKPSLLEKKDELDKKNTNEKIDKKEKENPKKTPFKKSKNNEGAPVEAKGFKKFFKNLPLKIKLIALGAAAFLAVFIFLYFILAFNSITNSVSVFFGIKEAEMEGDKQSPNQLFLYTDNGPVINGKDLTELSWPELIDALKEESVCGRGGIGNIIDSIYEFLSGGEFRDACHLIRYIRGTVEDFEKKYPELKMDVGLILGSVFFGFDQQAMYDWYEDPSNEDVVSAGNHFATLENIVNAKNSKGEPILTADDVMRIIKSTIFEEVYPNFIFNYSIEKDELGRKYIVGYCNQKNNQFYYNSLTKWEIFMRYNDDEQDNPKDRNPLFGMSGYMRMKNKKVLHMNKLSTNDQFLSLTGAGFVYDTNMNLSFESTDVPCNGSLEKSEFKEFLMTICDDCSYSEVDQTFDKAYNFFTDRGIKGIIDTKLYTQHIEDPDLPGKDEFKSVPRRYSYWTGSKASSKLEPANARAEFDYLKGFAYRNFPGFEEADNDPNLPNFNKDETWTPKKIETILEETKQRKEEFNEILYVDENGRPTRLFSGMYYVNAYGEPVLVPSESFYPKTLYYCEYIYDDRTTTSNEQLANLSVNLTDCEGNKLGTTSFKDYILGVTYGEIVINGADDDLILTQMVASMSYALSRRSNENNIQSGTISMKSGSCDQNWCDVYNGCVRRTGDSGYQSSIPGNGDRPALSSSTIDRLNNLYETASQYLLLDSKGDIYSAGYTTSRHEKWEEMANQGMSFIDILSQTYSGAIPIDCVIINDNKENIITNGTEIPQNLPPLTADQAQWAQMIIEKAMEIYEKYNGDFSYMSPSEAAALGINPRVLAYNGQMYNGKYQIDCNAFVSIVLNKALGIGVETANSVSDFQFVRPNSSTGEWIPVKDNISQIATGLTLDQALALAQPGDILGSVGDGSTHVQIYAGNGVIIDNGGAKVGDGPISLRTKGGHPDTGLSIRHQGGTFTILRVDNLN